MIYNGLGNGTVIERNKQRKEYVNRLSKDKFLVETLVDDVFKYIEFSELEQVKHKLNVLFCENLPDDLILEIYDDYSYKTFNEIENIKINIINRYCTNPSRGFIWNMYDVYINYSN